MYNDHYATLRYATLYAVYAYGRRSMFTISYIHVGIAKNYSANSSLPLQLSLTSLVRMLLTSYLPYEYNCSASDVGEPHKCVTLLCILEGCGQEEQNFPISKFELGETGKKLGID